MSNVRVFAPGTIANEVGESMQKAFTGQGLESQLYVSKVNNTGATLID